MRLAILLCFAALALTAPLLPQDRKKLMEEYGRRYRALDQKDVDQLLELANWCREKKLETYAKLIYRKALKLEPQNVAANTALGNERIGDRWYTPDEAREVRARLAAEARAAAAAAAAKANRDKTELPSEDEDRAAVKKALSANRAAAAELLDGYVEATGGAKPKHCAGITQHMMFVAKAAKPYEEHLAQIGEYVYRRMNWITFGSKDPGTFEKAGGKMAFYLGDAPALLTTMDFVKKRHPEVTKWYDLDAEAKSVQQAKLEFTDFHWPPIHVHLNIENQRSTVANAVARMWIKHSTKPWWKEINITRGKEKGYSMMMWLLEGVGIWASLDAIGDNLLYRVSWDTPRYATQKKVLVSKDYKLNYAGVAYDICATGKAMDRDARSFFQLCHARLASWHTIDLAMSFSLVDYLIRNRLDDWRGLVAKLEESRTFRGPFIAQFGSDQEKKDALIVLEKTHRDADLERTFRAVADRFEQGWKKWVVANYEDKREDPEAFKADAPFADPPVLPKK